MCVCVCVCVCVCMCVCVCSFNKRYEYCKTGAYDICINFSRFLATFS